MGKPGSSPTQPSGAARGYARIRSWFVAQYIWCAALLTAIAADAKSNPVRDHLLGLAFPLALYGVGFAMMLASPDLFWFGVCASLFACLVACAIWTILSWYNAPAIRIVGYIPSIILSAPILWLVLRPVSLTIQALFDPNRYSQGENVNGIKWKDEFSEVTAIINNNTALRFDNVTIWLRTDRLIERIYIEPDLNDCHASMGSPFIEFMSPTRSRSGHTEPIDLTDALSTYYTIQCNVFDSGSEVRVHLATVGEGAIYQPPTWASASVTYEAGLQKRERFTPICLKGDCERLPTSLMSDQFFKIEFGPPDYDFQITGANPLD
jgi:hypothetical protein